MSVEVVRYLTVISIALVVTALLIVVGFTVARGGDLNSGQVVGLLASVGTLVGIIVGLVGTGSLAGSAMKLDHKVSDVQEKVNGHLQQHIGHTDAEVRALVDRRLAEQGIVRPPTVVEPPTDDAA